MGYCGANIGGSGEDCPGYHLLKERKVSYSFKNPEKERNALRIPVKGLALFVSDQRKGLLEGMSFPDDWDHADKFHTDAMVRDVYTKSADYYALVLLSELYEKGKVDSFSIANELIYERGLDIDEYLTGCEKFTNFLRQLEFIP